MDTDNIFVGGFISIAIILVFGLGFLAYSESQNEHELKLKCLDKNMAYIDKKCFPVSVAQ